MTVSRVPEENLGVLEHSPFSGSRPVIYSYIHLDGRLTGFRTLLVPVLLSLGPVLLSLPEN